MIDITSTHEIFVVSDGTGRTADMALKAALAQFRSQQVNIHIRPEVRSEEQLVNIVTEAQKNRAIIVHTIVSHEMRAKLLDLGRLHNVDTHDIMGPLLAQLTLHLSTSPTEKPGLFTEINKAYFRGIEAMEFTFKHDDGQRIHELNKAEIVILGVSRTFKTPISLYLAFKGWMAANVPIIYGMEPPEIILRLPPEKVFALTTVPNRLSALRKVRHEHLGGSTGDYAKLEHVKKELQFAERFFNKRPDWPKIDVTNKPIEEIANEILEIIRKRKK